MGRKGAEQKKKGETRIVSGFWEGKTMSLTIISRKKPLSPRAKKEDLAKGWKEEGAGTIEQVRGGLPM